MGVIWAIISQLQGGQGGIFIARGWPDAHEKLESFTNGYGENPRGRVRQRLMMISATFLGYKLAGFWGALLATIAIFSPPFFIISLLIPQYDRLKGVGTIRRMEQGILAAFAGMLGLVLYNFGRAAFVDIPSVIFTAGAFIALLKKIDLSYILLTGAILSIILFGLIL